MANVIYLADNELKTCNKCGEKKPTDKFPLRKSTFTGRSYRNPICRACRNTVGAAWHKNNITDARRAAAAKLNKKRSKARSKNPVFHYRSKYGLTLFQKLERLAYQGGCAICGTIVPYGKKGWCVDHDHKTGELRSVLCRGCNAMLGNAADDPMVLRKAADYLDEHNKKFTWSYSKLKSFEVCPRRFHETDLKKAWPEEPSEALTWGDAVHKAMASALRNKKELPLAYQAYQPWVDKILRTPGELLVESECKWAITREFKPTAWFSPTVWLRCIADAVKIDKDIALVVDFKTGKSSNVDVIQNVLVSLMMFTHFPELKCIRSDFVWLQEDRQTTQVLYRTEAPDHWVELMPRVKRLQHAVEKENFPPTPGRFCRSWCPVRSCEYHGR